MPIIRMTLLTLLLLPLPGWSHDLNLFVMQRSTNTNEVQYQLHVNAHGHLVSATPVSAFWRLRVVSPEHTEALSALEQLAYGVTNQQVAEHGVAFALGVLDHVRALDQRRITATVRADPDTATGTPSVQTTIHGQVATLERLYVQTDERLGRPQGRYIDVVGSSVASRPTQVRERIAPSGMGERAERGATLRMRLVSECAAGRRVVSGDQPELDTVIMGSSVPGRGARS